MKKKKLIALLLAASMMVMPLPAIAANDSPGVRIAGGMEDTGGITNCGASIVENGSNDVMIQVSNDVWNNQNQKHAEISNAEELFKKKEFTLLLDLKKTEPNTSSDADKRALVSIGTESNNLHVFTLSGKLGYGNTVAGGGISAKNVTLTESPGEEWVTAALVYKEQDQGNGAVEVYINGKQAASVPDIGFKMSEQVGIRAMLGRSFNTSFLMGGVFDNLVVSDTAMDQASVAQEAEERLAARFQSKLQEAYDELQLSGIENCKENLPLIKTGKYGAVIDWTSDRPDIISDQSKDAEDMYDGGIVTRPEAGAEPIKVTLTARITLDGASLEKVFEVTVQPKEVIDETKYDGGYLWANFAVEGGYEKIFFGYSEDGLTWKKLNKDENGNAQPILTNDASGSDLGVRDPHLIRSPEGDRYWILGTDLHAEGGGAGGSGWDQLNASQNLVVWESEDLVNWSEPRLVYAGFSDAGCVWAPEAIYDEENGDYVVYWSARDKSKDGTEENALRVYVCRTRDFRTFSEPQVWLSEDQDSGDEVNIIDSTIVKDNGKYYRFSTSDWNTVLDESSTLDTQDVFDVRQNDSQSTPNGSWKRIVKRSESGSAGFDGREGITVYQLPDGKWCVMGDHQGYQAFVTDDLSSGKFTKANSAFVDGKFRHGTVIRLSKDEEARVLKAFGEKEDTTPDPEQKVLAEFDFNKDGAGFESENAKATGKYSLKDSYDEKAGKALYLDGSSNQFLTVTDKAGKSLLTGAKELTISFELKPDRTATNWVMYAAPDKNAPTYMSEKYIGVMNDGTSTKVERFNNAGERPAAPYANTGADWVHMDLVLSKTATTIYVNGKQISSEPSSYSLTGILGNNSILQIGKANWSSGEYFKGWIDNFRIENRALDAERIKELAADFTATLPVAASATVGTAPDRETALEYRGTDDHTSIRTEINQKEKTIVSYVRKNTDLSQIPLSFVLNKEVDEIKVNGKTFTNGGTVDLSKGAELVFVNGNKEEKWTIEKPVLCANPVLPGQYADPDIDYFDGKFWIYPTTDGYPGWSGTKFHAFSSPDMETWTDEGVILELANENPGVNENGVQIAVSPWAVGGSAWAPTIEEKNGKYYFYYCGKFQNGQSAIGVAVAENPAGPYVDKGEALMTVDMCRKAGVSMGQAIDPSIFTDDDGTSYLLFGNGSAAIAQLNEDMMSIKEGTLKQINGLTDFRESVIVTKANGIYHWTWSCDDANSPNYHVNYGVSNTLLNEDGSATIKLVKKNLLAKDESKGILGSAHQSVVHVKDGNGKDRYFMAYHRFYTPINIFTSADGLGTHRETCIDEITFDENGYMQITPTLEGVGAVDMSVDLVDIEVEGPEKTEYVQGEEFDPTGMTVTAVFSDGTTQEIAAGEDGYAITGFDTNQIGTQEIIITYRGVSKTFIINVIKKESKPEEGKPDEGKPDGDKPNGGKPDGTKPDSGKPDSGMSGGLQSGAVQTGDSSDGILWMVLGLASLLSGTVIMKGLKKNEDI